ncbi:unnamed protein product [Mytilus edulis]|uniref:Uncharacterized protein n=1 Tax=Mytilus edulis TaxID=6550 RepID=A0A8S3UVE4_MYTED|nr:unnamed protein product [Mytilus edulis]
MRLTGVGTLSGDDVDWGRHIIRKMMDIGSNLEIHIKSTSNENETFIAVVDTVRKDNDDIGALYYVVAVVLIYGLSIVMMIASHIRKNKQDNQLRTYVKEMAMLRKTDRREKLVDKIQNLPNIAKSLMHMDLIEKADTNINEEDEDSREMLLCKNSTFNSSDSVFQGQYEDNPDPNVNVTPKSDHSKSNMYIQVINENVPL